MITTRRLKLATLAAIVLYGTSSFGQDVSPWYIDAQLGYFKSRGSSVSDSLNSQELLIQYTGESGWGPYGFLYHDEEFSGAYIGPAYASETWGIGLGAGWADYDDSNWTVINPWGYYTDDLYNASFYIEYIPEEASSAKWFYKANAERYFGQYLYLGVHAQRWFGTGPSIGLSFNENLSLQLNVPVVDKEDMSYSINLRYVF